MEMLNELHMLGSAVGSWFGQGIVTVDGDELLIERGEPRQGSLKCDVLVGALPEGTISEGDHVLFVVPAGQENRAVILGRIAPASRVAKVAPDELVIEARQSLTLRVGDGSITIREDGRILIKGRELVSHAKGMNRIRGGSVAIN